MQSKHVTLLLPSKNNCWIREEATVCLTSVDGFDVANSANADYKLHKKRVGMDGNTTEEIKMEEIHTEMKA